MSWIIALAVFGFYWWLTKRASERATELASTGLLRSPLSDIFSTSARTAKLLSMKKELYSQVFKRCRKRPHDP